MGRGQDRERSEKNEGGRENKSKEKNISRRAIQQDPQGGRKDRGTEQTLPAGVFVKGTSSLGLESILSDQFPYFLLPEEIVEQGTLFSLFFFISLFLFLFLVCNRILGETFFFFCLFVFKE